MFSKYLMELLPSNQRHENHAVNHSKAEGNMIVSAWEWISGPEWLPQHPQQLG